MKYTANMVKFFYLLCTVLFLNSCTSAPEKNTPDTAPKKPTYKVYTVEIKDMKFVPDTVMAKKGDEVVFVNRDMVTHCVTEFNSKAWTSSALTTGQAYLHIVDGNATYYCAIHKVMKGTIIME